MKKRMVSIMLAAGLMVTALAGCSSRPAEPEAKPEEAAPVQEAEADTAEGNAEGTDNASGNKYEGVTLSFMSNIAGVQSEVMEEVIAKFEADTGAVVEYSSPGASYEELMKTKMAANQLPDLFTTHGWSIARYGQYLEPLNNQEWASRLSESAKQIVVDSESGNFYCLPVDVDVAGIIYNKTVLDAAGVNVDDLTTWDAFTQALGTIKDAGYTPVHIGGKDNWTIGQFFDWVAPSYLITDENNNHREALKDGSFDWSNWNGIAQMMADWKAAGYFNVDCLTADYNAQIKAMAEDKVAFVFLGNSAVNEMQSVNPDVNLGFMSVPASSDTGIITSDLEKYMASSRIFPYFDREYLPNGMWDDMCITGASILAEDAGAVEGACTAMEQSYNAKMEIQ